MKIQQKIKENQAITLISLVITVILLIILASVSINLILGQNGILQKAKKATEQYTDSQNKEETEIAKMTNEIDGYIDGNRSFSQIDYSTTEQDTGLKWIDAKPIYQKTIAISNDTDSTTLNHLKYITTNIDKIEELINCYGKYDISDKYGLRTRLFNVSYRSSDNVNADLGTVNLSNSKIVLHFFAYETTYTISNILFTIQYTKTTN